MLRKLIAPALAATLVLAACESSTAPAATTSDDDFALVMFGEAGTSLENTMGPQAGARPDQGGSVVPGPGGDAPRLAQGQERRGVGPFRRREQQVSRPSSWWRPSRRPSLPPAPRGRGNGRLPCGPRPRSAT